MNKTSDGIYMPDGKIALAFSFEGFVNDGAPECGLTTFNANQTLERGKGLSDGIVEPAVFDRYVDGPEMVAFLRLRPLVNKAYQYFFVIDAIRAHPEEAMRVVNDSMDVKAFDVLIDAFKNIEAGCSDDDKKMLDEAFYAERKRMQQSDKGAWTDIQKPIEESIKQLKYLKGTLVVYDNEILSGFVPYFATSKDFASTWDLCNTYVRIKRLGQDDVNESPTCLIPRGRIISKDEVPSRSDIDRLKFISERDDLEPSSVWRINDRYDEPAQQELRDAGYRNQILVPGYTFPHDIIKARGDGKIFLIEDRSQMAKLLGNYARETGF